MAITDTAVGAILEIPTQALKGIKDAERAIWALHDASKKAADQVYGDFARRMPDGVQKFIDKLAEANKAMDGLGTINVTLKTGAAVTEGQKLSTQMQKTSADVSKAVQDMSSSWSDLGKVNIKGFDISNYGNTLAEVLARLTQLKQDFKNEPIGSGRNQAMADEIRQLEEAVRLYKQAAEEKNKALANIQQKQQNEKDKAYLDEQKRLLDRILQLRKDISQISISVQRGTITGKTDMSADLAQLEKLRKELTETGWAYRDLRTFQSQTISEDARIKAEIQSQNTKNAGLRQEVDERNKLAAAITRANELTAQGQQGKTRLGSGEEAAIQRQLNSDYKNQLKILKEIGEIKAKAAEQGKTLTINSAEVQLIQALAQRYRVYAEDVNRVAGAYRAMGEAAAKNFAADRSEQLARNAIMLADAQKKAEGNTKQLTAEYKRLYAENQKLAASMDKIDWGKISSATMGTQSFQNMSAAWNAMEVQARANQDRMAEIARKNIDEVNEFKRQKEMEANQKSISDFVQAEAQKKAAVLQAAQEESNARKQALQAYLQSYQGAMAQADKIMSGRSGTSMFATNLENIKRAINDLKAASGNLNLLNPADVAKAEQLKRKIAELETLLKKYKDASTPDKPAISPQDAINAAKNATTLKQLEKAYKDLKEAMSGVDSSKPIWTQMNTQLGQTKKQIDDIKKKMGEFNNEAQKTSNIMGQLQSRIAAAFSVGAIMGFAKKVTEVRAQFELQRVALGAIIQDKDEANKVFLRVQQMALESPFSIMQLERSTKQIAAFGFEAKQLVPTMKMVADIGAGLGVELNRIVLVLGHMKARGYLEGTMVRQFTNMGFNVLGELAKYYTELEGRMVSVADVQERVKKKMVEFGDVEEVLKRVTSAGGMFYDMQKKQSDSIWGQMQRITDAYDLMLNEIGQSNEGSIKAALTAVRTLINSWRTLLPLIKAAGAAMVLYFAVSKWGAITTGLAQATSGFRVLTAMIRNAAAAQRLFNAEQMASGWGTLVALIGAAVVAIWQFATAQSKLNEELERTQSEGISDMYGLIFQYRTLADTVKDSTKSYDERKKALDEINRVYKDILPDYMTEINYIKSISDGYMEATEAIKAYSAAKIMKNKEETIENEYGKQIQEAIANNAERFTESTFDAFSQLPQLEKIDEDTFKGAVSNIMTVIAEEIKTGEIPVENAAEEFKKRLLKKLNISQEDYDKVSKDVTFGLDAAFKGAFGDVNTWWSDIFGFGMKSGLESVIRDMNKEMGKLTTLGLTSDITDMNLKPTEEQFQKLKDAVTNFQTALAGVDGQGGFSIFDKGKQSLDEMQLSAVNTFNSSLAALNQYREALGLTPLTLEEVRKGVDSAMDSNIKYRDVAIETFTKQLDLLEQIAKATKNEALLAWVENMRKEVAGINLTPTQKEIEKVILSVEQLNGINLGDFKWAIINGATTVSDARKDVETSLKQLKDDVERYQTAVSNGMLPIVAQMLFLQGQTVDDVTKKIGALTKVWGMLGGSEKSNKKSSGSKSDKELKRWQDLKKAIEEVQTAYDKARKSFSVEESNRQIEKLFGKTFTELGANIKDFYKDSTYDAESLIKALDVLLGMTKATTEERKKFRSELQRSMADTQVEIDVKAKEDSEKKLKSDLDRLFDSYDLSKTLMDANIPINLVPMVGGRPIKSLEELREIVQGDYQAAGGKNASENVVKEYEDRLKKIDDMEVKQQQERLKSYQQYLAMMYSDRAQTMIKSYTTMKNMERDFAAYRANLEKEAADPATTEAHKQQIAEQIAMLEQQAKDAIAGVKDEMDQKLNQFDWNAFKGSPVFTQMYSDLQTLSKQGIDMLIEKLTVMREKLQSMENVDYRAVREITQYINKLNDARIDTASWKELFDIVQESRRLNAQGMDMETAEEGLMASQEELDSLNKMIDDINTVIALKDQEGDETDKTKNLTADQLALYGESKEDLQAILKGTQKNAAAAQDNVDKWSGIIDKHKLAQAALKRQIAITKTLQDEFNGVHDACVEVAEALGEDTDIWGNFAKSVGNLIFTAITLTLQFQLMGIAANSSLGIIGWIAIALQVIANLLVAIFAAHDKSLQKRIEEQQEKVEKLERAYDKLKDAVDSAFEAERLRSDSRKAEQNIKDRIKATEEMIRLEKKKKKVDKDQIKEWEEDIEDLNDELDEFKDNVTEAWGGFGSDDNYQSAVEDFTSAWLDAFNETGDGLDALNDKWDEYIDNLIKKQIGLAVMGPRIKRFMKMIDSFVGEESDQGEYLSKSELDQLKALRGSLLDGINEEMKLYLEALGYTSKGETVLSDLQKGIQNITEPQAAAIEAYLNSMRFAVFRHTEQLDMLIQIVGAQYGVGTDNPVVNELKGIRMVLDSIDSRLDSVIKYDMGIAKIQVV